MLADIPLFAVSDSGDIMRDDKRQAAMVRLWLEHSEHEGKQRHLMVFYGWLQCNRPDLLTRGRFGNSYQNLKAELQTGRGQRGRAAS